MIQLEGVTYAGVGPYDLALDPKALTAVIGPNGAGKSLMLKLLHGLVAPTGGTITRGADDPTRNDQSFVAGELGFLERTARDNLVWLMRVHGMGKQDAVSHADGLLSAAGLGHLADRSALTLSAGEQAVLGLARGLVAQPELVLLDEPTAHLDPSATKNVEAVIADMHRRGLGIIMTTHDLGQARRLAEQLVIMVGGKVVEAGAASDLLNNPKPRKLPPFWRGSWCHEIAAFSVLCIPVFDYAVCNGCAFDGDHDHIDGSVRDRALFAGGLSTGYRTAGSGNCHRIGAGLCRGSAWDD